MSLTVNIRKSYGSFTLDVAFEAGDETLGFLGADRKSTRLNSSHRT